ncbi:MAG: class I SAM-dependent methyltransferase [Planctomycetota bacterium]
MSGETTESVYLTHPQTCAADDYWGQVRRTVNGQPLPQRQIDLIVDAMAEALDLGAQDRLLDLCCGNGALTTYWFARCAGGLGVDFSPYLVDIARQRFSHGPHERYHIESVLTFAQGPQPYGAFDKAVCYGSLQYLRRSDVAALLRGLRRAQPTLQRLVLGNVPDRDLVAAFARPGVDVPLDDPESAIGCWWGAADLRAVAEDAGWDLQVRRMPSEFYSAHYRFDAVLTPRPNEREGT